MTKTSYLSSRLQVGSDELTLLVTSDDTGGALLAAEVALPAGGGPPGLHRHAPEEIYRLERGELAIHIEDDEGEVRRILARRGDVVHIPGGRAHTVRNESDAEALAYVVFAPGTEMEQFVRAASELTDPGIDEVVALAARHGIEMV